MRPSLAPALLIAVMGAGPARAQKGPSKFPDPLAPAAVDAGLAGKIVDHLFNDGDEGKTPDGRPGRCLYKEHQRGKGGDDTLACLEVKTVVYKGKVIPAVQEFLLGDVTVIAEAWIGLIGDFYGVQQWTFKVSADGRLLEARRTIFMALEGATEPASDAKSSLFSPSSKEAQDAWKAAAGRVLRLFKTYRA